MNNIEEEVRRYISDNILFSNGSYPYADDASFLQEGIIDSAHVLELVMFVESQFQLAVEDEELLPDNFDSVSRIAGFVRRKQQGFRHPATP